MKKEISKKGGKMSNTTKKIIALIAGVIAGIAVTYIVEYRYITMRWAAPLTSGLLALFLQLKLPKEGMGTEMGNIGKKILGFALGVFAGIVVISMFYLKNAGPTDLTIPLIGGLLILFFQSNTSDSDIRVHISNNSKRITAVLVGALIGITSIFYFSIKGGILDIIVPVLGAVFFWFLQSYLIKEEN